MTGCIQTILIFGLGLSGQALASFFNRREVRLIGFDDHANPNDFPFPVFSQYEKIPFKQLDTIAYSPGIPKTHPLFLEAAKRNIPCQSEIQIGVQEIKNYCIGVTGTNGKSTVSALIAHLLHEAGQPAVALGNIGIPLTAKVDELNKEVVVLELSSYQIDDLQFPFLDQGALLNISEDHLDWYGSYRAYACSKISMQNCIKKEGRFVIQNSLFRDYEQDLFFPYIDTFNFLTPFGAEKFKRYWHSLSLIARWNQAAALKVLEPFGISPEKLLRGLRSFKGLPHRCEDLGEVENRLFINDSKGTNLDSVKQAVASFERPIRLLMGGKDKGLDFSPLLPYFKSKVEKVYAFGEVQNDIRDQLSLASPVECFENLEEAFKKAWQESKEGEVLMLSPGSASFDQFKNFEHRGNEFKRLVSQLKGVHV